MAKSWAEAREIAAKENLEIVYHDYETGEYGASKSGDTPGHFKRGAWIPHKTIAMPATTSVEDLERKEQEFLSEHPDWVKKE